MTFSLPVIALVIAAFGAPMLRHLLNCIIVLTLDNGHYLRPESRPLLALSSVQYSHPCAVYCVDGSHIEGSVQIIVMVLPFSNLLIPLAFPWPKNNTTDWTRYRGDSKKWLHTALCKQQTTAWTYFIQQRKFETFKARFCRAPWTTISKLFWWLLNKILISRELLLFFSQNQQAQNFKVTKETMNVFANLWLVIFNCRSKRSTKCISWANERFWVRWSSNSHQRNGILLQLYVWMGLI